MSKSYWTFNQLTKGELSYRKSYFPPNWESFHGRWKLVFVWSLCSSEWLLTLFTFHSKRLLGRFLVNKEQSSVFSVNNWKQFLSGELFFGGTKCCFHRSQTKRFSFEVVEWYHRKGCEAYARFSWVNYRNQRAEAVSFTLCART